MYACLDGQILAEETIAFTYYNRAFQYGDRLFETMIFRNGRITFLDDHLDRLCRGMKQLGYTENKYLIAPIIAETVLTLVSLNQCDTARVKLIVWRKEGGRYTPTDNQTHFLLTTEPYQSPPTKTDTHVSICRTITLFPHSLSPFKCCSLPYVVAGIEKKERKLDDIILLNHKGYLVECLVSNLFWKKDGIIFTPSLSTGCIDGVFRKNLLAFFKKIGQPYAEVEAPLEELFLAQSVFTTNVAGIRHVLNVDSYSYLPLPDTEEWEKILIG